jgi:hypothetical protein
MATRRHPTFTITHLHGVTFVTIQHGRHTTNTLRHPNNMATSVPITNIHGFTSHTYRTMQHGRHATRYIHHYPYTVSHTPTTTTYTYVTIEHGRRAKRRIHNYQYTRRHTRPQSHIRHYTTWPTHGQYQPTKIISSFPLYHAAFFRTEWMQLATTNE